MTSDKVFNLTKEPWIWVMESDSHMKEVSLLEVLKNAHGIRRLANELPTLDFAILRLLLAVLHSIFARYDTDGNQSEIEDKGDAIDRWESLWNTGRFPEGLIEGYLHEWEDRFYLFHPERPFYQVPNMGKATEYNAPKLIGDISQSSNKLRLFSGREDRKSVPPDEAARWLIYLNAYDDTSSKPKGKAADGGKLPSVGAGYLGKLGMIVIGGDTLFHTLMLNFVLAKDGEAIPAGFPSWEKESLRSGERTKIPMPSNMAELLTLQSRRIELVSDGNEGITGYKLLGGDFFETENAFIEQMTLWRKDSTSKQEVYKPRRHNAAKQFWRDFSALVAAKEGRRPGVLRWLDTLEKEEVIDPFSMNITIAGIEYGDKDFFVDGIISDGVKINSSLLFTLGEKWLDPIIEILEQTDNGVRALAKLASDIALACGDDNVKERIAAIRKPIRENAYYELDIPFRNWISGIDPKDDIIENENKWRGEARKILTRIGEEYVDNAPEHAFTGRYIGEQLFCSPRAFNMFKGSIKKALPLPEDEKEKEKQKQLQATQQSDETKGGM